MPATMNFLAHPPPVLHLNAGALSPFLLVCDHASKALPPGYGTLGLPEAELARHIGWDIGAARVTARMADVLNAPAVLSGYSRLLVDYNRATDDPTFICQVSDGTVVPGNRGIDAVERQRRIDEFYEPYHAAVGAAMARLQGHVAAPALISIHSFTPVMRARPRPWHVGVLWNKDPRIAVPLMRHLAAEPGLVVGDNEPYSGRDNVGHTIRAYGAELGLPHVLVEVRQDLIGDETGAIEWGDRLAGVLTRIIGEQGPFKVEHF